MKIKFGSPILTIENEPIARSMSDTRNATLGWITVTALLAESEESLDSKVRCFTLAQRIGENEEVEITPEEATTIKNRIGAVYKNVTVCARAVEILNG